MWAARRPTPCGCWTPCRPMSFAPAIARSAVIRCWRLKGKIEMSLDALRESLPAYAKDLNLNLSSLVAESLLTDQQKWGCFVASAYAVGVPAVVKSVEAAAAEAGLSEAANEAAKAAAAIM